MKGKIDYKFLNCAKNMPALYNKLPDEQYDIAKSEVISWLVSQPEVQNKIFEMAKAQNVIEYDSDLKKWKGIDFITDYSENESFISEHTKPEIKDAMRTDLGSRTESIGAAIYSKCLEKNLSLFDFFSSLNGYSIYIDDLYKETLNSVVVYGASQVVGRELYDQIQNDNRIMTCLLRQLINSIGSMRVSINAEVIENDPIYISVELKRNNEETIYIECEADINDDRVETFLFSVIVKYRKKDVMDEPIDASKEACTMLDRLCRCNTEFKYIEDDILRICKHGIKDYVQKLTADKTIEWKWNGIVYTASMGEENYSYAYEEKEDAYSLEIDISDRLVFSGKYSKDEVADLDRLIKKIMPIVLEKDKEIIGIEDFLVRSSNYNCVYRFHNLQRIHAIINILKNGKIEEVRTEAAYCPECDKYYILERDYIALKRRGIICCKVVEFQELFRNKQSLFDWQEKSILRTYGYTVSKTENLTKQERHQILDFVMENGIMTSNQIISHLLWQIKTRENMSNMRDAISKWEDDIHYVRQYQFLNKSVRVRQIFIRHK